MYVCEKCHEKYQGFHLVGSFGPCEDCGEIATCYDCNCHKRAAQAQVIDPKTGSRPAPKIDGDGKPIKTFDPASLRDMLPDGEAAERGRAIIAKLDTASGKPQRSFGTK